MCKCCGTFVIAKCGRHVTWHWAHSYLGDCDPWLERETEWHRNWKNQFPVDWQEIVQNAATGDEKHIADIKSPGGIVVEFQHSPIKLEERNARENFYEPMVWVVDGCRNFDRFGFYLGLGGTAELMSGNPGVRFRWTSRGKLPQNWCDTKHPVFFDFDHDKDFFWQLVAFDAKTKNGVMKPFPKLSFISEIKEGKLPLVKSLAPGVISGTLKRFDASLKKGM